MTARPPKNPRITLRQLAETFHATNWSVSHREVLHPEDVFSLLDITPEQVTLLCATGFIKAVPLGGEVGIPRSELVRFIEKYGDWWFQLRGRKQLERLKEALFGDAV